MLNPFTVTYRFVSSAITSTWLNFVWIPFVLFLNILVYTPLLRVPLLPLRYMLEWDDVPVDVAWLWSQFSLFFVTVLHFAIASCFIGAFVGVATGLNLKLIRFAISLVTPEASEASNKVNEVKHQQQGVVGATENEPESENIHVADKSGGDLYRLLSASITNVTVETIPTQQLEDRMAHESSESTSAGTEFSDFSRVTTSESESGEWEDRESVGSSESVASEDTIDTPQYARELRSGSGSVLRNRAGHAEDSASRQSVSTEQDSILDSASADTGLTSASEVHQAKSA